MTELEKISYAKSFIDKLANGINPLDDTPIPDGDIVNNVRLSRCFFYVSDILRQVIENGGISVQKPAKIRKKEFTLTDEERAKLRVSDRPLSASEITSCLYSVIDQDTTKKLSARSVNDWLEDIGLLETVALPNGKSRRTPTPQGKELGIFTEERSGQYGTYLAVLYSPQAQQFIYDNIEAVIESKKEKDDPLAEFHGRPWTEQHIALLTEMHSADRSISEMAYELKRTEGGIRSQLKKMGLIK